MKAFARVLLIAGLGVVAAPRGDAQEAMWQNLITQYQATVAQGLTLEAAEMAEGLVWVAEQTFAPHDLHVAESLELLAKSRAEQGMHVKAEALYGKAIAVREDTLGPSHPSVAAALLRQAESHIAQGLADQAAPLYERALSIRERTLPPDDPEIASTLILLGNFYVSQAEPDTAEEFYQRALEVSGEAFGRSHPKVATTMIVLADFYASQGRLSEAESLYQRALATRELTLGTGHPTVATAAILLSKLYASFGNEFQAEQTSRRALSTLRQSFRLEPPGARAAREQAAQTDAPPSTETASGDRKRLVQVAEELHNRATTFAMLGRHREAVSLFEQAVAAHEKAFGPRQPEVADVLDDYARLLRAIGEVKKAAQLTDRARLIRSAPSGG